MWNGNYFGDFNILKFKDIKKNMLVEDKWFYDWGIGKVFKVLKTVVHIHFSNKGMVVFDKSHTQFLKRIE
jgi:hypothetical protein